MLHHSTKVMVVLRLYIPPKVFGIQKRVHRFKCKMYAKIGTEAIRTQIQPSKPKREITKITDSQNTKRTYGQPSEQLFKKKVATQQPKSKKVNREPQQNCRLGTVSNELLVLTLVLCAQPRLQFLKWYKHLVGCSVRMITL